MHSAVFRDGINASCQTTYIWSWIGFTSHVKQVRFLINYLIILRICNVLCFQLSILWRLAGKFYKGQQLVEDCRIHYLHTFWAHTYSLYQKKIQKLNMYLELSHSKICITTRSSYRKKSHIRLCKSHAV